MSSLGGRSTPTRTEKLSCPAIAGKGDHPAQQGGGRGAGLDAAQVIQGKLGINAYCSATIPTRRDRRPLHHSSLASRAPVVPLPRFAGAERKAIPFSRRTCARVLQIKATKLLPPKK